VDGSVTDADVVVLGAGLAGLAAARAIVAGGQSVVVLEARDRVGGRVYDEQLDDGTTIELGGAFIGPGQDRMYELAGEFGLATHPTFTDGESLLASGGRLIRHRGVPRLNPLVLADLTQALARIDRLSRRVPPDEPWRAPKAAKLDAETFATWLGRNVRTNRARALLETSIDMGHCVGSGEVSVLQVAYAIRTAGGVQHAFSVEGGAQQDRIVGGAQQIAVAMAERLGADVRFEQPVTGVTRDGSGVSVTTTAGSVRAERAIVALPPPLASRIAYDPPLPAGRDQLMQRIAMGSVIKCVAIYDEPFWRTDGLCGEAVSDTPPVQLVLDGSPPGGGRGVLVAFVGANAARTLVAINEDERREVVASSLVALFGPRAGSMAAYREKAWADDQWSRGCFAGEMPPGAWTAFGSALRPAVDRIHWAGTEVATMWSSYMEGAVRSGEAAAAEVLASIGDGLKR
jgi:monoamine oxidase